MNINKIDALALVNKNKSKAISRSIHALNIDHTKYCKLVMDRIVKYGLIDDVISMSVLLLGINLMTVILYKGPGLVSCILIDMLLLSTLPVIDLAARFYKAQKLIIKDRNRLATETEIAKKFLDKCYQYIYELENIKNKVNDLDKEKVHEICKVIEANPVNYSRKSTPNNAELTSKNGNLTSKLIKVLKINQ